MCSTICRVLLTLGKLTVSRSVGKAINNRLIRVADRLISKNQTTFIKGRFILESVVAAHEILHNINKNKESVKSKLVFRRRYAPF